MVYLYDGSFEGLLTCVFEAYASKKQEVSIVPKKIHTPSFLDREQYIQTDMEKFRRVYSSIPNKISKRAQQIVYRAWLSEYEEVSNRIFRFLQAGYKMGASVVNYIQDPAVHTVIELNSAVGREAHRFLGLLRFQEIADGVFYAGYEPDFNITVLVAPHFTQRLASQPFLIHDKKRNVCAVYDGNEMMMTDAVPSLPEKKTESEDQIAALWKAFFKTVAIKERKNPRTQMNFMPKKYWKNLLEMNE